MITLRRSQERHHDQRGRREGWQTFHPDDPADALAGGFGTLEILNEDCLPSGTSVPRLPHHYAEIITYVREGALAHEDSTGRSGVIKAGEFQRMTAVRGLRHSATNASRTNFAHVFQIWLRPSEAELESDYEQRRFSAAERRDGLCVVASSDGRRGSLRVRADALVYSALLDPGQHVVHELPQGRRAWVHLVNGDATLNGVILTKGDSAGVTAERAISLTAREETEILLLDLGEK